MGIESVEQISTTGAVWSAVLTIGLGIMGYLVRKRDDKIDCNTAAIQEAVKAHNVLELKIAENYATKVTMLALFDKASQDTKEAVGRAEKRIDETNVLLSKQGDKLDTIIKSASDSQKEIMMELTKKT